MTTFFPVIRDNRLETLINLAVNSNPVTFSFRSLALAFPELVAPLGVLNDQILRAGAPSNLLDPQRRVTRPFQLGDRVRSDNRQIEGTLFGGYILAFPPGTGGAIVFWDGGFLTYDPLSDLQPQSLRMRG